MTKAEILASKFAKLAPLARCRAEGNQIYVRYATGFSEYLSLSEVSAAIRFIEEGPKGG